MRSRSLAPISARESTPRSIPRLGARPRSAATWRVISSAAGPLGAVPPEGGAAAALERALGFSAGPGAHGGEARAAPAVLRLPHLETMPWADVSPDRRAILRRMATLFRLSQGQGGSVLV